MASHCFSFGPAPYTFHQIGNGAQGPMLSAGCSDVNATVRRYLDESEATPLSTLDTLPPAPAELPAHRPVYDMPQPPLPPQPYNTRRISPNPSLGLSNGDSEPPLENGPRTPPDASAMETFYAPGQADEWPFNPLHIDPPPAEICIDPNKIGQPIEIDQDWQQEYGDLAKEITGFGISQQGYFPHGYQDQCASESTKSSGSITVALGSRTAANEDEGIYPTVEYDVVAFQKGSTASPVPATSPLVPPSLSTPTSPVLPKVEPGAAGDESDASTTATEELPRKRKADGRDDDNDDDDNDEYYGNDEFHFNDNDNDDDDEYVPKQYKKTKYPAGARGRKPKAKKRRAGGRPLDTGVKRTRPAAQPRCRTAPQAAAVAAPVPTPATVAPRESGRRTLQCHRCTQSSFMDETSLRIHIKKQHTRPFFCVFSFAGCPSTFATKNEWKRHVMTQHLLLHYWVCNEGICARPPKRSGSGGNLVSSTTQVSGVVEKNVFNRKDLHKQHVVRMHMPDGMKQRYQQQQKQRQERQKKRRGGGAGGCSGGSGEGANEEEEFLALHHMKSIKSRCSLPTYMRCPAQGCTWEFRGPEAWDQRMEHVAKHLEKAADAGVGSAYIKKEDDDDVIYYDNGRQEEEKPLLAFGGPEDTTLIEWASRPDVAVLLSDEEGGWKLNKSLRDVPHPEDVGVATEASTVVVATAPAVAPGPEEEDAEGEECDDELGA